MLPDIAQRQRCLVSLGAILPASDVVAVPTTTAALSKEEAVTRFLQVHAPSSAPPIQSISNED